MWVIRKATPAGWLYVAEEGWTEEKEAALGFRSQAAAQIGADQIARHEGGPVRVEWRGKA